MKKMMMYIIALGLMLAIVIFVNGVLAVQQNKAAVLQAQSIANEAKQTEAEVADGGHSSHLPIIVINTKDYIKKDEKVWAQVDVFDSTQGLNSVTTVPAFSTRAKVRYRGESSYTLFDKKQYLMEFYKPDKDKKQTTALLGLQEDSDWILNGPFLDRSLLRNRICYAVADELNIWSPDTRYAEVVINDVYMGLYLLIEPINGNTLNLSTVGLLSGQTAYIVERDRENDDINPIYTYGISSARTSYPFYTIYPAKNDLTNAQFNWITNDINEFEQALYSDYYKDPFFGYAKYIDIDSFVDYYILAEFSMLIDAGYLSTFIYKEQGGKLKYAAWDYNNAFNNFQVPQSTDVFIANKTNWYMRLLEDRVFVDKVVARYKQLRSTVLSEDYLFEMIDENILYLDDAIDRNFDEWGYTFKEGMLKSNEDGSSRDPESFEQAVAMLKKTIVARGDYLDAHIEDLYEDCVD